MFRSVAEGRVTRLIRNLARKQTCSATSQFRSIWGFASPYILELVGNWLLTNKVWFRPKRSTIFFGSGHNS